MGRPTRDALRSAAMDKEIHLTPRRQTSLGTQQRSFLLSNVPQILNRHALAQRLDGEAQHRVKHRRLIGRLALCRTVRCENVTSHVLPIVFRVPKPHKQASLRAMDDIGRDVSCPSAGKISGRVGWCVSSWRSTPKVGWRSEAARMDAICFCSRCPSSSDSRRKPRT